MNSKNQIPFTAKGESPYIIYSGLSLILIVLFYLVLMIINSEKVIGTVVGLFISLGLIFALSRFITQVEFNSNQIIVTRLFGNRKLIQYSSLEKLYKNHEGFLPAFVYVVKYSENKKLKKFTFYKSDIDLESLKLELAKKKTKPNKS